MNNLNRFQPTGPCDLVKFLAALLASFLALTSASFAQENATSYAPANPAAGPNILGHELVVEARLSEKGDMLKDGIDWRVFSDRRNADGQLPLIAKRSGGTATFSLPAGTYLVHAGFGRASTTRRVSLGSDGARESFVLNAGGLALTAKADGKPIPPKDLRFSIYELEEDEEGERKLIALNVPATRIIRLNAGTYHVLSRYGTINATVRADLEVKPGKLTRATLQHRGAAVSMRLVSSLGGDPVANTAWTVLTQDGEKVFQSTSVSPGLILAEGTYEATVRNGEKDYRKTFRVSPGKNIRVEVPLK